MNERMIFATMKETNFLAAIARHWACFTCREDDLQLANEDNIYNGDNDLYPVAASFSSVSSSSVDEMEEERLPLTPMVFPVDEIHSLLRRHQALSRGPAGVMERPPLAGGVLKRVQLLGVFPTCRWLVDATMPPDVKELFGGTPFFPLGEYRVANIELLDGVGTLHPLTMIVNTGVEGMLTGYWGAVFEQKAPHVCWARFETPGERGGRVHEEPRRKSDGTVSGRARTFFQEYDGLDFTDECFTEGSTHGVRRTQLERILAITAEFLLQLDWSTWLPEHLIEVRDTSCRLERKRRARITRQRASRALLVDEGSPSMRVEKLIKHVLE